MNWVLYTGIFIVTFAAMEGITWLTHRYIMHGWLWYLHEDHHQPTSGFFEKNDAFFIIFAIPTFFSLLLGAMYHIYWLMSLGFGVMAYGAAYFLVHDVIIHQRFKWFSRSGNNYIRALRWAHKMHHKHLGKKDGESFGMLYVSRKYWMKITDKRKMKKINVA
jgi:beta-carotene 3-hydroxylase